MLCWCCMHPHHHRNWSRHPTPTWLPRSTSHRSSENISAQGKLAPEPSPPGDLHSHSLCWYGGWRVEIYILW
jgi:hypothetical protein